MKVAARGVARRYARAILEVAQAEGKARELRPELGAVARGLAASPALQHALLHPALPTEKKRALAAAVFAKGSPLLLRALDLVASRGRLALLPGIAEEYAQALLRSEGVEPAELVTAVPLADSEAERIRLALCAATGKDIELQTSVDPSLLGGVLVRIAGRYYDGSVRGRLLALKRRLTAA
jgi:F-type H+-transporting ATPase subunit delta